MSDEEFEQILKHSFNELYMDYTFIKVIGGENYKKMETVYINNIKFITSLIPERKLKKISPPEIWEFPKGKKSIFENGIDCAKREFEEETGIKLSGDDKNHFHFINDPITETLVGDDKKNISYNFISCST